MIQKQTESKPVAKTQVVEETQVKLRTRGLSLTIYNVFGQ